MFSTVLQNCRIEMAGAIIFASVPDQYHEVLVVRTSVLNNRNNNHVFGETRVITGINSYRNVIISNYVFSLLSKNLTY